jgi:hypothetical protein
MALVVVMVVVVTLVMAVVSGGIVRAVARRCDTGSADHDRPGDAEQCDCACESLGHLSLLVVDPSQGARERVAPSRGHWS